MFESHRPTHTPQRTRNFCTLSFNTPHPYPADTRCWINVGLKLVQRRRRCTNVKPTLIQRLVSARYPVTSYIDKVTCKIRVLNCGRLIDGCLGYIPSIHDTLPMCWFNVGPLSATLAQHWTNTWAMSRVYWVTRRTFPANKKCQPTVYDAGIAFSQHRLNVYCLLG